MVVVMVSTTATCIATATVVAAVAVTVMAVTGAVAVMTSWLRRVGRRGRGCCSQVEQVMSGVVISQRNAAVMMVMVLRCDA